MGTSQAEIRNWLKDAKKKDATHVVVVCDTFDWEDYHIDVYPVGKKVYSYDYDDVNMAIKSHNGVNMQKVMEVYNLSMDLEKQLNEHRAYHI